MFAKVKNVLAVAALLGVACAGSAWASLPYYNPELGYTIWLADNWVEEAEPMIRYRSYRGCLPAENEGWQAAYRLRGAAGVNLLVSRLEGKLRTRSRIADFNRHVVRELKKLSAHPPGWSNRAGVCLRKANFDSRRNMLRLEMDALGPGGDKVLSVVYVVYTRSAMLKFVGLVPAGDTKGVAVIDAAVATLYLDQGLSH